MHYENMSMQYTEIFKVVKNENFQQKFFDIFLIFAQNIDCISQFSYIKVGFKGVFIARTCLPDDGNAYIVLKLALKMNWLC